MMNTKVQHTPYDKEMEAARQAMHLEPSDRNVGRFTALQYQCEGYLRAKAADALTLEALKGMMFHHQHNPLGWPIGGCGRCQQAFRAIAQAEGKETP